MQIERWSRRALILTAVICLPFLGFLISQGYPLLRVETAAALGLLLTTALTLSAVCRGVALYVAVLCCGCIVAAAPLQRLLRPVVTLSEPLAALAVAALTAGVMLWLRRRFFELLLAFSFGTFAAHWLIHRARLPVEEWPKPAETSRPVIAGHVLHVVLDEQMGPACLPDWTPSCRRAAASWERTLAEYGFRVYRQAYSNYPWTLDSVPSVLQGRLLRHSGEWLRGGGPDANGALTFEAHSLFEHFRRQGYEVVSFEDRRYRFAPARKARVIRFPGELATVGDLDWPWTEKLRTVVAAYQASGSVLSRFKGLFPLFRFGHRCLSPLATPPDWPRRLAEEILKARRRTFFFAHVLLPHGPYVYDRQGSILRPAYWRGDLDYDLYERDAYRSLYSSYCEQVLAVSQQIETLLARLREGGALPTMTIVVHGDHGSRIRLRRPEVTKHRRVAPELYDYGGTPPPADLRDRFSILFAVKPAGVSTPTRDDRPGGLLRFITEVYHPRDLEGLGPAADEAYLFDEQGRPVETHIGALWKESHHSCVTTSTPHPEASPFRY